MSRTPTDAMNPKTTRPSVLNRLICVLVFCIPSAFRDTLPLVAAADPIEFDTEVRPILQKYCTGCHTSDDAEGGYVMETHQSLIAGGEHGVAITPGSANSSRLTLRLQGKLKPRMPPEGEARPTATEAKLLADWIDQGAIGPSGPTPLKRSIVTPALKMTAGTALPVTAMAVSEDQSKIAIARYGEIEISDDQGVPLLTIQNDLNKVNAITFSSDGARILAASGRTGAFGLAAIYSTSNGELLREFVGHRDVLYAAAFSPDERYIATAGYDREIVLWNTETGELIRRYAGHNGAIFDLCFSNDGSLLASACADETVKIWHVETGQRLDTLSQPEGEVLAVLFSADDSHVIAGSSDNRLRIWKLQSKTSPQINPLIATRYLDETALTHLQLTPDGKTLVVISEGGGIKLVETKSWSQVAALGTFNETANDLVINPTGDAVTVCLMNGEIIKRTLPSTTLAQEKPPNQLATVYLDLGPLTQLNEIDLRTANQLGAEQNSAIPVQRGVEITGSISSAGQQDLYQWTAKAGEQWAIDADSLDKSLIDPIVTILGADQQPVLRTRLQAIRDSYFTFRGKDSSQVGDFRLFNWEEMRLNDYLYAAGEVTRLWLYPRGPDSGYNVYPNDGQRWTYFGTTHTTHALGEPAYVVRPVKHGEAAAANGLPTFDIFYQNDDDPQRLAGKNSRLVFSTPADGQYSVRVSDTRASGGDNYQYRLRIRPATPSFKPIVNKANGKIHRGTGREFTVRVDRFDGFDGEVTFDIPDLPPQITSNLPVVIEAGQRFATGNLWVSEDAVAWEGTLQPEVIATASIQGKKIERRLGPVGELTLVDSPNAIPTIQPVNGEVANDEPWLIQVRRGETTSARVLIRRKEGFNAEVSFGKEDAGRNTTHGVYVDNIGLNGLLVRQNETAREFFITADPIAKTGKRYFHLKGANDGGVTSHPIVVEVLP